MPDRKKIDFNYYIYWKCSKCEHVVVAKKKPDISWADGHRCTFVKMHEKENEDD